MTRRPPTTEIRIVLRTILSAGVLAVLLLACVGTAASAQSEQGIEMGAGPIPIYQTEKVTPTIKSISTDEVTSSEYNYVSHIFTVADVIFFSYNDGTELALYDSSGALIWNNNGNPLNKGEHAHVSVSQGVYTIYGSKKFSVLTGDPITRFVVGYYAMDQNGYGVSTELYTWVPQLYGHCSFIIFAYDDNTQVTVEYTDTGVDIATFTLNKGQHWRIETLDTEWIHVTANNPVSALTAYDQGYFVPSANKKWSGTEFYTYVGDVQGWPEDLTVIAYNDDTSVTIKDSNTGAVIWSGTLDSGQAHAESYPNGADRFFTITSSKTVTVSVQPWVSVTSSYHQGAYVPDSTGTVLGTDIIGSTLDGGYLYILAYKDNTNVVVYNSQTGGLVNTYTLNAGDHVEANPGNGLWRIMSNYHISVYSGCGTWNADFASVEFRVVTDVNVDISTGKNCYAANEDITISAEVTDADGNPLYPLEEGNFKVSVDGNEVDIGEFERIGCTDYRLKIKAPETLGTYSITVTATTAADWESNSVGIKVYTIGNVHLTIEGNRLTQYENSADTPIYYRGDSNIYPIFYIGIEVNGATFSEIKDNIQVFANIGDYTKVEDSVNKQATYDADISKYKANWKNSPNNYPVGEYNVTAEVKDLNGNPLASYEKKHFYLVFKPPDGYEGFVGTTHSSEIHSRNGCPVLTEGAIDEGTKFYRIHQFERRNWKPTIDKIRGNVSIGEAARTLLLFAHGIDDSYYGHWHMDNDETRFYQDPTHPPEGDFIYGSFGCTRNYAHEDVGPEKNAFWYDVNDFLDSDFNPEDYTLITKRPTGVCVDYAPLLISNLRSAGIPAREIGGDWAGGGHAFTEVYYDNEWHHYDPTWNVYDYPVVYATQGRHWEECLTKTDSPECDSPIVNRINGYNQFVRITDITFDKADYDYPDPMTIDVSVQAEDLGSTEYLRLRIYDHPTILPLLELDYLDSDNLIVDLPLDLDPKESRTVSINYQLPDYGLLNGLYESLPGFDRYIKAEVDYYRDGVPLYKVDSKEEKIPGLCVEWSPYLIVDDSDRANLSITNADSFFFNETINESTEIFDKPNESISVEHKIKYDTNYTKESWYIFNPSYDRKHNYSIIRPLVGIGDAIYIPGYGTVTNNQSDINANVDYVIIYNSTLGTNGVISTYAFSKNTTIKNVTAIQGAVINALGEWNHTIAEQSGESFLIYLSTGNGSGMSFNEIYNNFAQEIVSNGDTLTQFFIEGEHEQISYYKIRDTVYVNTTISNNGILPETRNLSLVITEPGVWNSENVIYNTTETVTIPAKSEVDATFQYQIPDNPYIGKHRIIVSDGITKATTIFMIQAPFNVAFDIPATVAQAEEFYANATITNALGMSLSGINVTIDLPNDFNTSESLTKNIGTLSIGESADVSWLVTATDFEYGYTPITIYINSAEGINDIVITSLTVLRLPELRIYPSAPSEVQINTSFEFKANVTNEGDLDISGVSVDLLLPENVTTTDDLTKLIGDLAGGETRSVNWMVTSMRDDDFWITVNGCDVSGAYCAHATEFINIVKPEIELDLVNPVEVILNQSFPVIAKIKNTGELNATQVKVNLSLPPEFETLDDTFVNMGDLSQGQTKELEWTLRGVDPGYGDVIVNVTLSGSVSITRGIIVTCFPLSVETDKETYMRGDNVIITTMLTNNNPEISYIDLLVNVTIQGTGVKETYSLPIDYISSLETRNFALTWDTTGKTNGTYTITAKVLEDSMVLNETSTPFILGVIDIIPPTSITDLRHTAGQTWINWTWTNPPDPDFNYTMVYLDGIFATNVSITSYNATGLTPETSYTISTRTVDTAGNINQTWVNDTATTLKVYNITFLPPIATPNHFNLTNGRTLPIKFTTKDNDTGEFIYDDTVNVTITNSTGHLIAFFTNGTGTDSVRINSTEEQYIVNFNTKDYDLNVGETYTIHITFGEADTLWGYAITHFTLVDLNH